MLKVVSLSLCYIHFMCPTDAKREYVLKHFYVDNSSTTFFPIFPVKMILNHHEAGGIMGCTLSKVLNTVCKARYLDSANGSVRALEVPKASGNGTIQMNFCVLLYLAFHSF